MNYFFFDEDYFFAEDFLLGTLPPALRASDNPIAIACFLLVTFFPDRPLFSVPSLRSCIAFSTFSEAFLPYLAIVRSSFVLILSTSQSVWVSLAVGVGGGLGRGCGTGGLGVGLGLGDGEGVGVGDGVGLGDGIRVGDGVGFCIVAGPVARLGESCPAITMESENNPIALHTRNMASGLLNLFFILASSCRVS